MDFILILPIVIPVIIGCICLILPWQRVRSVLAFTGMLAISILSFIVLLSDGLRFEIDWIHLSYLRISFDLLAYHFSSLILLACSLFGLLITTYSLRQMQGKQRLREYYTYLLWTVGFANGAVLANNFVVLLIFWGMVAIMLYLLINIGGTSAQKAAQKSLIIVGGSDFLMLLGVVILWHLTGSLTMSEITIPIKGTLATAAFFLLMAGAIAKAGAMPFHSWIPDAAEAAPIPVMAFLPAALDKLLGIYLLVRICIDFFVMNTSMKILLMSMGVVTIIAAVMMALIQKDLKKLLSFHAISQVGYMVLGIGTGTPIGIAGGLFHMFNHAIYKSCLFLCSGSVEYRTKTTRLEKLGGLARSMPVTFIICTIAALSISGVPPFNGFVSKWMIYQGTITWGKSIWPVFLIGAMFGSALTLASFVKVIHSVFLGEETKGLTGIKEAPSTMTIPMVILGLLCVIFGIFALLPLKYMIGPVLGIPFGDLGDPIRLSGIWSPVLATLSILFSLLCGMLIYRWGKIKDVREGEVFVGGESIDSEEVRISGIHFYDTIQSIGFLKFMFEKAKAGTFDLYELGKPVTRAFALGVYHGIDRVIDRLYNGIRIITLEFSQYLRKLHTGVLSTYLLWVVIGITILLLILMK